MADMDLPQKTGKRKVQVPRIDLTPMVDLGFLLITFFIFTTTMAKSKTMEVNMPFRTDEAKTSFVEESTITLIPTKEHGIVYYHGAFTQDSALHLARQNEIRDVLIAKQRAAAALPASLSADAHQVHVIIKPNDDCKYEDVVSLLDEMNILQIPFYAVDDVTQAEKEWLENN